MIRRSSAKTPGGSPPGDVSRITAREFQRLYLKHAAAVEQQLAESVRLLGPENFVDCSPVPEGLFDKPGWLTPPPGLTSADPKSVLAESRSRFDDNLQSVLEAICREQPVSSDAIEALRRRLAEWQGHASPRDVQAFTWCRRMKTFIECHLAQPARHASLRESLLLGFGPEFDGDSVGELIGFLLERNLGPAPGNAAARCLTPVTEALCLANVAAERQERKERLDRAADRLRLAKIERKRRAVVQSARYARWPRSRSVPVLRPILPAGPTSRILIWSNAHPVRYRTYWVPGSTTWVPGGTTYRCYVTTTR